jgi:hypothetical protein
MYRPNRIEMQRACSLFKSTGDVRVHAVEAVLRS